MKKFIPLIFLCLLCSTAYADIATGLVGWWKFDEASSGTCGGANILDASGSANTGTCHANPTWVGGKIGLGAGSFVVASSQYVQTTTATNIPKINGNQTLSAWVNLPATGATYDIVVPELNGSGANQLRVNAGNAQVSQWGGTITITGGAVSINTWHMLTWTYNNVGPVDTIYIDGVQSATAAVATQAIVPTVVCIGTYGAGEYFGGYIDDVRIYNRALTAADVAQLYMYTGKSGFFTLNNR